MTTLTLSEPPSLRRLYVEALATARGRHGRTLPDTELVLGPVDVDRDRLAAYDQACGFRVGDRLPPTYLHVLAYPLQIQLMTDRAFPFALPRVVHLRNVITQRRPVDVGERPTLQVRAERLARHPKGATVDLVAQGTVEGELVWVGRSTYFFRGAEAPEGTAYDEDPLPEPVLPERASALWSVPADTGRRYAKVSGDMNPIHLNRLAAKAAGFPRTIAHGMWSATRCLAALEGRLPDAFSADIVFAKPLLLPSRVELLTAPRADGWDLGLRAASDGRTHLLGTVRPPAS